MIETPHSFHTHIRSSLYIHNAIQHLLQWLQVIRMLPRNLISAIWDLRVDVVGIGGGSILVLMIETPHSLHTHSSSSSRLYKVFQNLLLRLVVMTTQPQPDMLGGLLSQW